jgi:hypothetical protein
MAANWFTMLLQTWRKGLEIAAHWMSVRTGTRQGLEELARVAAEEVLERGLVGW